MKTICFGEILFDQIEGERRLGGAPYNLAFHLASLGAESYLVSAVGADEDGKKAREIAQKNGVLDDYIKTNDFPTGLVHVELDNWGVPTYEILENRAYDYIELTLSDLDSIARLELDCFCFGTLARRNKVSERSFRHLLARVSARYKFCDLNLREGHYSTELIEESLRSCDILKISELEAVRLKGFFGFEDEAHKMWRVLRNEYDIKILLVTRGKDGVSAYSEEGDIQVACKQIQTNNTVGAGDAFSGAFLQEYFKSGDLRNAVEKGDEYAREYIQSN